MPTVTVHEFITSMTGTMTFDGLFAWPPDVFAVTSAILKRSGAYRHMVCPPGNETWPPIWPAGRKRLTWTRAALGLASDWLKSISDPAPLTLPAYLEKQRKRIAADWDRVSVEDLSHVERHRHAWSLCRALLILHAVADSACRGFGTPTAPSTDALAQFVADHLLSSTGSLARLPRSRGIVLPKMRTPQTGLTLRATSLYATWHETEVTAVWRSTPWVNSEENTLNVLIVPWPQEFEPRSLQATPPGGLRRIGTHRYFRYAPTTPAPVHRVVELVREADDAANRVHLLVLPELALGFKELRELQNALARGLAASKVPLIVTGVRDWQSADHPEGMPGDQRSPEACNCVVLSMFFAGKWYHLRQSKHHRWRIDRRQVKQYNIGAVLPSDRAWWEHFHVPPRNLSVLAPTGWLAMCPLICEDLAQLEPVADVIRGVGPTLLVAVLFDGPQLPTRWSAKYASVLADDPGTSVLTVTCRGLAERSTQSENHLTQSAATIASWRDTESGFVELSLPRQKEALLVTLAADWREELSADGRSDGKTAAMFVLTGSQALPLDSPVRPRDMSAHQPMLNASYGDSVDLYELTTLVQLVDAALDASWEVASRILDIASLDQEEFPTARSPEVAAVVRVIASAEAKGRSRSRANPAFKGAVDTFRQFLECSPPSPAERCKHDEDVEVFERLAVRRWRKQLDMIAARLGDERTTPVTNATEYALLQVLLWAIHNRLERMRRSGRVDARGAQMMRSIEGMLDGVAVES